MIDIILKRRSCRYFIDKEIPDNILEDILTTGVHAPSGNNLQNYRFLVIKDKDEIKEIAGFKVPKKLNRTASIMIIVFSNDKVNIKPEEYYIWSKLWPQNCAAAIQNMLLAATYHKIGSCWIAWYNEMDGTRMTSNLTWKDILKNHNLPNYYSIQGMVLLGYTDKVDNNGYPLGDEEHAGKPVKRPLYKEFLI